MLQISAVVVCPDGWRLLGRRCYRFYDNQEYTQPEADAKCARVGAHLAVLNTEEEIALLRAFLSVQYNNSDKYFWIGMKAPKFGKYNIRVS